ncbi:MAG: hypothetical protein N3B01_11285, partial [Verrucomicrobiae bacterium]|nr:hypothetical protein [Verrucomicrobiae bacterium]
AMRSFARPARAGVPTVTHGVLQVEHSAAGTELVVGVEIVSERACACELGFKIHNNMGIPIGYGSVGLLDPANAVQLQPGRNMFRCRLQLPQMAVGQYFLGFHLAVPRVEILDRAEQVLQFEVDRPPAPGKQDALRQEWNVGCVEIPMTVERQGL